ncbi:MAG: glycerophosphodiester phosphodiesterase [Calditrichaeota bacterium]|nr:MAG: glycerophosphodiester phosphodiesterase [Calditrichota bacterium]
MKKCTYLLAIILLIVAGCESKKTSPVSKILYTFNNPSSPEVLVAAHRAVHLYYPENSLAAIQHAIDMGVAIIEIDVRQTMDGMLILMHDKTLERTTNGTGRVDSLMWSDIKKLSLKNAPDDSLTHFIPTLEQALLLGKNHLMFDLDNKSASLRDLVALVQKTETQKQVMFFDHDFAVLDSIKLLDPKLLVLPRAETFEEVKMAIARFNSPVIQINADIFTSAVDSTIKAAGANLWVNSLGKLDRKARKDSVQSAYLPFIIGNADIVQTDNPDLWLKLLDETRF